MIYWDSSALLPLVVKEVSSTTMLELFEQSDSLIAWVLTPVEVVSGICRLLREGYLDKEEAEEIFSNWRELQGQLYFIKNIEDTKQRALRLIRVHPLKSADALQLGAALIACEDKTSGHSFITLDAKLREAAYKEGFETSLISIVK